MNRVSRILIVACASVALLLGGCMSGAWKQALRDDTPAAYYRFLRDHPNSKYVEDAQARLEFHKIKRRPSLAAFSRFSEKFPESPLLDELRPMLEEQAFEAARGVGTPEAYEDFVELFPNGVTADRALGNAAFLRDRSLQGNPQALQSFASAHPASDFADEALRTIDSLGTRDSTRFQRVGLRIEISPGTPELGRVLQAFTQKASEQYENAGVTLVPIPELVSEANRASIPKARLEISHREDLARTQVTGSDLSRPGIVAKTTVTLHMGTDGAPIWQREFELRVPPEDHLQNTSALFGPSARRYWSSFFVPVATWHTKVAVRSRVQLSKMATAIDAVGDRALVLFEDGDFQLLELSNPTAPVALAEHRRPQDFKRWDGIRAMGDKIAIFGPEGLELIRFTSEGTETVATLDRGTIGSLVAVEPLEEGLLLAGKRGLILTQKEGADPITVLRRSVHGMARMGDTVILSDGESVLLSTIPMLRQNRVLAQLKLGRQFGPGRVRAFGQTAVVVGQTGVLAIDMANPRKPRVVSQLHTRNIGPVQDAVASLGQIFILGERGLQVLDARGKVVNSIDVATRARVTPMGRHLVAVGDQNLQVVDATPFTRAAAPSRATSRAASPAPTPDVETTSDSEF